MLKVAFLGRGELGLIVLNALINNNAIEVKVIIACDPSPDVPLAKENFEEIAKNNNIEYLSTNHVNNEKCCKLMEDLEIDLAVALLWLYKISEDFIKKIKIGVLNLHGGLLPKYRGNACQTWAILNDEKEIGITCHLMEGGKLDSGPIVRQTSIPIKPDSLVGELIAAVTEIGSNLVLKAIDDFVNCRARIINQDENNALYCYPRLPADGEINWKLSSNQIHDLVRAANKPYPGAYSFFRNKKDNSLCKLVIYKTDVIDNPVGQFCAVPGHLIKINNLMKCGVVCGDMKLLLLEDVEINEEKVNCYDYFKTVRQRLGLSVSSEIDSIWKSLNENNNLKLLHEGKNINDHVKDFIGVYSSKIKDLENKLSLHIEILKKLLRTKKLPFVCNKLKNLSFTEGYYDYEEKNRFYGVQIYQSIKISFKERNFNFGFWFWADEFEPLHLRVYINVDRDDLNTIGPQIFDKYIQIFGSNGIYKYPKRSESVYGYFSSYYSNIDSLDDVPVSTFIDSL